MFSSRYVCSSQGLIAAPGYVHELAVSCLGEFCAALATLLFDADLMRLISLRHMKTSYAYNFDCNLDITLVRVLHRIPVKTFHLGQALFFYQNQF